MSHIYSSSAMFVLMLSSFVVDTCRQAPAPFDFSYSPKILGFCSATRCLFVCSSMRDRLPLLVRQIAGSVNAAIGDYLVVPKPVQPPSGFSHKTIITA